jgi:hypothetical protein
MAIKKYSTNVKCPYYHKDVDIRLVCDGITQDMTTVNLIFPSREKLLQHRRQHCSRCWDECPVKKAIDLKSGG